MADGFLNFIDMINGGGAGDSGDEFEGGGLLSMIGNALFQPYGYRQRQRAMAETRPQMRPESLLGMQPMPAPTPAPMPRPNPMASGMTPANAYVAPQQYSTSGMTPANAYVPTVQPQQYDASGMTPANAYQPLSWADMLRIMAEQQQMQQFGRGGPRY